jgi:hypothetical protein
LQSWEYLAFVSDQPGTLTMTSHDGTEFSTELLGLEGVFTARINPQQVITSAGSDTAGLESWSAEEAGLCVSSGGAVFDSDDVTLLAEGDFETESRQKVCLALCEATPRRLTGCEAVWGRPTSGCYAHSSPLISRGNGQPNHSCWVYIGIQPEPSVPSLSSYSLTGSMLSWIDRLGIVSTHADQSGEAYTPLAAHDLSTGFEMQFQMY